MMTEKQQAIFLSAILEMAAEVGLTNPFKSGDKGVVLGMTRQLSHTHEVELSREHAVDGTSAADPTGPVWSTTLFEAEDKVAGLDGDLREVLAFNGLHATDALRAAMSLIEVYS